MEYKYRFDDYWVSKIAQMDEFANGATQVSVSLRNGKVFHGLLVSGCQYPVAVRGYSDLPFNLEEIESIFQTEEDKNPREKGSWVFWDKWV